MDQDDELIAVLPVHLSNSLAPDIQLHQFPLLTRPLQVPPSAAASGKQISAKIKPNTRRLEIHIPSDTRPDVWNAQRARELGTAQLEDDLEKNQEQKGRETQEPRLSEMRLRSEEILQNGTHMLGVIRDGRLHLHTISELHQFRPTLTYLDVQSQRSRRSRKGMESGSESDDGPPPDPDDVPTVPITKERDKKPAEMREIHVSTRKVDDKGTTIGLSSVRREMLQMIRAEEDEEWQAYEFCDHTTAPSEQAFASLFSTKTEALQCKTNITTFLNDIRGL
ncbi:hypothetical protein AMATHDRAFT_134295 [Amanita thiersii Skay4041]|uniref:DNA-directed RNA polymerase III subunit Rpc5 n=1 Tax=Amanita thiersii Skay4041 TaxID=703135 RepID=A0A2A9NVM6_9AGAR|nr:hypothetical protein AMATHDRAFT_134295 [Amanita thiersii Skay4041]